MATATCYSKDIYLCVFIFIVGTTLVHGKNSGFLMTMPQVLRQGSLSEFCLTMHGHNISEAARPATFTLYNTDTAAQAVRLEGLYPVGQQKCVQFLVPERGEYELMLSNDTDILHDTVKIKVLSNKLITLVQTDKPTYKPGQLVKFRILTLLVDLKPRTGQIKSIYVKDPDDIRVKQFRNIESEGLTSLEFQLGTEPKMGQWKIAVNLDEMDEARGMTTVTRFTVKEYVLPRFEVKVKPPTYILSTDETFSGTVCGKYTYGKPVKGFLTLAVCWASQYPGPQPCHHEVVELDGCYNFTVNATEIKSADRVYYGRGPELEIRAKIVEAGTGATVSYNHTGPRESPSPLSIELDDYSNGCFKPGLPYYGKVTARRPDGSPAAGQIIQVRAEDHENSLRFSSNITTDAYGVALYAFCGEFGINSTTVNVNVEAIEYTNSDNNFAQPPFGRMRNTVRGHRRVQQWFSPSLSYMQISRPDAVHTCGERLTLNVAYTTRAGVTPVFHYQVMARGQVLKTGQVQQEETTPLNMGAAQPPPSMCLHPESVEEPASTVVVNQGGDVLEMEYPGSVDEESVERFKEPIVRSEHVSDTLSSFLLDLPIEPAMSPKFTVLVHHVMKDGEVVADSMQFDVEPCFQNTVSLKFNESQALPGQSVEVELGAAPGSLCGVGVVDKSVNILGGDHQITAARVFEKISEFITPPPSMYRNDAKYCEERIRNLQGNSFLEMEDRYWLYNSPYVDAQQAFKTSGTLVLTDLDLETRPCREDYPVYYDLAVAVDGSMPGPMPIGRPVMEYSNTARRSATHTDSVRSHFPETWLWDIHTVGPSGKVAVTEPAPHTITTWVGGAMCINKDQGFGLSEMTSLTTFQAFFLSVHLPYAAVRGERLPILLTVYNYLEKCITVKLDLDLDVGFKVHNGRQFRAPICVCGGESNTAKYYVTPKQIGSLPVVAKATIVSGSCRKSVDIDLNYVGVSDQVHRKMLVKAEGVEQSYTHSSYMCSKDGTPLSETVRLMLPDTKSMVKGSARGEVQVIGDIMGPALSNLERLVRMPTGCGEQTMVGFVPNILVMDYLSSTGGLNDKIKATAIKNMEAGYQRELNYRHKDGSFSAFGERDPAGSVWLTAFVVKSFAQAQKYINIDEEDLALSIHFLVRGQLETGCFRETGKVFSSYMMGGMGKTRGENSPQTALTAYVLVALMKAGFNDSTPTIAAGLECMNRQVKARKRRMDVYTLALATYANVMYKPDSQESLYTIKSLHAKATSDDSSTYWSRGRLQPPATNTWFYTAAPSAEVEMTSYALMSFLRFHGKEAVEKTHSIATWLSRQRNPQGGFASTQDTVVGLDALSQFASLAYSKEPADLTVKVKAGPGLDRMFTVSDIIGDTRFLLQSAPLPTLPTTLNVSTSGMGCALVQANVRYNKPPKAYLDGQRPKFQLRVSARPYKHDQDRCDRRTIHVVVGSRRGHKYSKGMGLLTVKMVTSWAPVSDSITHLKSQFPKLGMKRIEHNEEEGLVTFYFDEFTRRAKRFTLDIEQDRELKVSRPKPAEAKVFEYYETDVANVASYRVKTTCGTKLEIPRTQPQQPAAGGGQLRQVALSFDQFQQRRVSASERAGQDCPLCITNRNLPENFELLVCNSSAVYKGLSGRNGVRSLKFRQDLRPTTIQKGLSLFASYKMGPSCSCSLLSTEGGIKRVLVLAPKKVSSKLLILDSNSVVMKTNMKAERAVRKALANCPL